MALKDAIASAKGRVEDLKMSIQNQRTKKEECAMVVSQHRLGINHVFCCIFNYYHVVTVVRYQFLQCLFICF